MGLYDHESHPPKLSTSNRLAAVCLVMSRGAFVAFCGGLVALGAAFASGAQNSPSHELRAQRFLAGRQLVDHKSASQALAIDSARRQHRALLVHHSTVALSSAWQPIGPAQIATPEYGSVTGRITAIAIDPADPTGNTVYIGTTGGGVWKSTNAAGPAASVSFAPLTDDLSVFNTSTALPSLSIGALSIANGTLLAGTGDPNDALDSYYGSGILRSADGGMTWTLIQQSLDGASGAHSFLGLGFAGIAWSTSNPGTVVAAVSDAAEGPLVNAGEAAYSTRGLYYSIDSGVTWLMATIVDGTQTVQTPLDNGGNHGGNAATSVVWNPLRQRFYAAVRYHGYYESADGMVWTRLAGQPGFGLTNNGCPADPGTTGSANCPIFRGALAVEPVSGDTYAFTVDAANNDEGIWRDICASNDGSCAGPVAFGTQLDTTPLEEGSGSKEIFQGDYNLSLAAVAAGTASAPDTLIFAGTVDLSRCSIASGCSFRNTTNIFNGCAAPAMVAPAQHAIAAIASLGPLLYLGNDGGLYRSLDGVAEAGPTCSSADASHFQNLNGGIGSLAETVSFAQPAFDANTLIIGVGANGTAATSTAASNQPWPQLASGEGGYTAIDSANPQNWYISTAAGVSIDFCGSGAGCTAADFTGLPAIGEPQVDYDASVIDPPWLLDPNLSANLLIGTCRVWRGPAQNGAQWSNANAISANFGGAQETTCTASNPLVRSLAAGGPLPGGSVGTTAAGPNTGSTVIYAGLAGALDGGGTLGGHLFSTTAANIATPGTAWTDLALNPVSNDIVNGGVFNPGGFDISSIFLDAHDPTGATLYATVMGFAGNGINAPHLYRSADFGAHWINLSSNLPDAPANGVAVDPNDPQTVYIALDTGVYATTAVSTCATTDCWSVFGSGLPEAPVIELIASATVPAGSGNAGELRAGTYGRGIWQIPLLTAAPAEAPIANLTPDSLTFATLAVGTTSPAQTITLSNTGTASLIVTGIAVTGDFAEADTCGQTTLPVGATCSVKIVFKPVSSGELNGTLTILYQKSGDTSATYSAMASLTGTAAAPAAVAVAPASLNFGSVVYGSLSGSQTVTVSNTGGLTASLSAPNITENGLPATDFSLVANSCSATLPPGTQCSLALVFAPAALGTRNGVLAVATQAFTQTVSLTGVGAAPATDTLSPAALTFAPQQTATSSVAQTVSLSNSGDAPLTQISATITSQSSASPFTLANNCAATLAAHAACTFSVVIAPTAIGPATAALTVTDQFRTQTVPLSGSGVAPPQAFIAPASLTFLPTLVGLTSHGQEVVVTNIGGGLLPLGTVAVTGDFTEDDDCSGVSLPAGIRCGIDVSFAPTATGTRTGTLTIPGTQTTIALTGTGATPPAIVLAPSAFAFGTIIIGTLSATQTITVSNTGGLTANLGTITLLDNPSGDFRLAFDYCGSILPAGAQCTVGLIFAPSVSGPRFATLSVPASFGTQDLSQNAALTGTGDSAATDTLSPISVNFGPQLVGTSAPSQTVTIINTGDAALIGISAVVYAGSFALVNGCGAILPGHSTCSFTIGFDPQSAGPLTGQLTIADVRQTRAVPLTGTGVAPAQIALTPVALAFGSLAIGSTSSARNIAISNTGGVAATLQTPTISGDFSVIANTCGTTLAPGVGCTVAIVFAPGTAGARAGTFTLPTSVGAQTAALSGVGLSAATDTLSPLSLSFAAQQYGTVSAAQTVTLSNSGDTPLSPIAAAIASGPFTMVSNCGGTLAAHSACILSVAFAPIAAGAVTGSLTVSDPIRTQGVVVSGTGVGPPLAAASPVALSFTATAVGTTSTAETVTVTNAGGAPLSIGRLSVAGDFLETDTCANVILAAAASCAVQVVFVPAANGIRSGTLTVVSNSSSGHLAVGLTGVGVAPAAITLTPASLAFGALTLGSTSPAQSIAISNTGGVVATLQAPAITGDFALTADTCGATLAANAGCTASIAFTPKASGSRIGAFSIPSSAGTQSATLTGTGQSPATDTLSPLNLLFAPQQLNSGSAAQIVTLTNSGDATLTLIAATISSPNFVLANTCGPMLPGHSVCTISVTFDPIAGGPITATLTISDQFHSQVVALSGTGIAPPLATLMPASLSFPATASGNDSPAQSIVVLNSGGGQLIVSNVSVTGDFRDSEDCTTVALPAAATCTVKIMFSPTTISTRTGMLTLVGNMPGGQVTASLTGIGANPATITLTPNTLSFGTVMLGTAAAGQNISVSNIGGLPATLQPPTISGDFAVAANTCAATLPAATGCTVSIVFTPTASGLRGGTLSIATSAGTQTAALAGTGASPATDTLAPLSLSFAAQQLGTTSPAQSVTLTNAGDDALTLISTQAGGDFLVLSSCGNSLIGHASCAIAVTYAPKSIGPGSGTLTVSDQFRTQNVALSGTGIAPPGVSLSPAALTFAPTGVTLASPAQTVTLSNQGGAPLLVSSIAATGDFTLPANSCGASIAPGVACTIQIVFAPTVAGPRSGILIVSDNAAASPQSITLTGTGIDFSLAPDGPTSATVSTGESAAFPFLLTSAAGLPGTVAFTCTGVPANASCTVTPADPSLGAATIITAFVETGIAAATAAPPSSPASHSPSRIWLATLLPAAFLLLRIKKVPRGTSAFNRGFARFTTLIVLSGLLLASGCGSGRTIPPPATSPVTPVGPVTPAGTYAIAVAASSAGLTRTVPLTLVVQ